MTRHSPTASSVTLHGVEKMEAAATPENGGAVTISIHNGGYETFDLTIFTHDAALSVELAAAINGVLAVNGRLHNDDARVAA